MIMIHPDNPVQCFLAQAFGPGDYRNRAAKILGVSYDHIRHIEAGSKRLTLRQRRAISHYCNQRCRDRRAITTRELAKVERLYQEAAKGWAVAELIARAKEAEFARQGRK